MDRSNGPVFFVEDLVGRKRISAGDIRRVGDELRRMIFEGERRVGEVINFMRWCVDITEGNLDSFIFIREDVFHDWYVSATEGWSVERRLAVWEEYERGVLFGHIYVCMHTGEMSSTIH